MAPFSPSSRWSYMKNIKSPSGSLVIFTPENVSFAITLPPTLLSGCEKAKPRRLPAARVFRAGWTSWYILAHDHRKPAVLSTASVSSFASTIVLTLYFATHPPLSLLARDACSVVDLRHLYRAANGPPHKKCFTEYSIQDRPENGGRGWGTPQGRPGLLLARTNFLASTASNIFLRIASIRVRSTDP